MAEGYQVRQGAALTIDVTLRDGQGTDFVNVFDGTEPLKTVIWPGGNRAASFEAVTTWNVPEAATLTITITGEQTVTLAPGRYDLLTQLNDGGEWVDCYADTVTILAVSGVRVAPRTYPLDSAEAYAWLLRFGRSWLRQLESDVDEAGFAEQMGRARTWFDGCLHNHYRVASMALVVGGMGLGPRRSGARSTWLQDQLDADFLMITDEIKECVSKKALAFILEGQVGVGEGAKEYARLAKVYHSQADYLATCMTVSLDTNQDGFPDVNVDLSCTDPMIA